LASHEDVDEERLVEAAKADPARFLELYDRYFHRIYAYVVRRARNRADAEDVTSEVFRRALANLEKYEWRGMPFAAWLVRIAANELADRGRKVARAAADHTDVAGLEGTGPDLDRRIMLYQLVERLPDDQRRVVELRFGEDRSTFEVAHALGRSEGAIKQLQRRALENLRKAMEGSHG
jgi:RNA polymerase sigma-70 factor (ECF subfamily)